MQHRTLAMKKTASATLALWHPILLNTLSFREYQKTPDCGKAPEGLESDREELHFLSLLCFYCAGPCDDEALLKTFITFGHFELQCVLTGKFYL